MVMCMLLRNETKLNLICSEILIFLFLNSKKEKDNRENTHSLVFILSSQNKVDLHRKVHIFSKR